MSESDSEVQRARICSESEPNILLERQTAQLQEKIDDLTKENMQLKAQFEQALKLTSKFDKTTQENMRLSKELSNIKLEKENLSNRLEILVKAREELEAKIVHERQENEKARRAEREAFEKELADMKTRVKQQISDVSADNESLQEQKDGFVTKVKMLENDAERVLKSAGEFFRAKFHSLAELTEYLDKPVVPVTVKKEAGRGDVEQLKSKVRSLEKANAKLKKIVAKLEAQAKTPKTSVKKDADDARKKLQMEIQEKEMVIESQQKQIEALEANVAKLKGQSKADVPARGPFERVFASSFEEAPALVKGDDQTEELEKRIRALKREVSASRDKCETLEDEKKRLERDNESVRAENKKLQTELAGVQKKVLLQSEELAKANGELDAKRQQLKTLAARELKVETLKAREANFEVKIKSLEGEITDLQREREDLQKVVEDHERQVANLTEEVEKRDMLIRDAKSEIDKRDINDRNAPKSQDPISQFTLKCSLFDTDLSGEIDKIVATIGLQTGTKIQNIYKVIYQYYSAKLGDMEKNMKRESDEFQTITKSINQFLVQICVMLSLRQVTVDEFVSRGGHELITSAISDMRASYDEARRGRDSLQTFVQKFQETFDLETTTDQSSMLAQLKKVMSRLELQKQKTAKRTKQIAKLRQVNTYLERQLQTKTSDLKAEKQQLQDEIDSLSNDVKELTAAGQRQKRQINSLEQELTDKQQQQEESEAALVAQQQRLRTEQVSIENELRNQIQTLSSNNDGLTAQVGDLESALSQMKRQLQDAKSLVVEKEKQITKLQTGQTDLEHEMRKQSESEKISITETYERTIAELRQQCEDQRQDMKRLESEMQIVEKGEKATKTSMSQLKAAYEKLQREMAARLEQAECERKLVESTAKSRIVAAETTYRAKSEENKARFESEKRKIFVFVADQFRQYFDPHETIDENSFRAMILRVKEALNRLTVCDNSVRRLVGAEFQQRTDEAVCHAMLAA